MDEEIKHKLKTVEDALQKWHDWYRNLKNYELNNDYKEEFLEVTTIISEFLPELEDPILFEIDDILYPGKEYKGKENCKYTFEPRRLFDIPNISTYFRAYSDVLWYEDNIFIDNIVFMLIKHINIYCHELRSLMEFLLNSKQEENVCRGLKMYKIVLEGELKEKFLDKKIYCTLSSLKDIAEAHKPDDMKISKFISTLAGICCNLVGEENPYIFPEKGHSPKEAIIQGIHCLISNAIFPNFFLEYFYKTFSESSKDILKVKRKYLKYILRGIISCRMRVPFKTAITIILNCLLDNIRAISSSYRYNDDMILIDHFHEGREIKPYLEEVNFVVDSKEVWADDDADDDDINEVDLTFAKFFYYDKAMKNLHLLTIIYTAIAECKNLCVGEFDDEDYTKTFRGNNALMENVAFHLQNRPMSIPWYVKKTMVMCPFLLFPLEQKNLVVDLIEYVREEKEEYPNMNEELRKKIASLKTFRSKLNDLKKIDLLRYRKCKEEYELELELGKLDLNLN